jgi:hypothetical protein
MEENSKSHKYILGGIAAIVFLLVINTIGIVFVLFNPPFLSEQSRNNQLLREVSSLTAVNAYENPVIAQIKDAAQLRSGNAVNQQVYKDAKDGDFVLAFSDKMVIFRRQEDRIVYEGPSPVQLANQNREELYANLRSAAEENSVNLTETEEPQITVAQDVQNLKETDSEFYANVQQGDVIALYPESETILLYRPTTEEIVNTGRFSTGISQ